MDAETAYLFRHALVREAAYELQTPGDRGRLHALVLEIFEEICGGTPEVEQPPWMAVFLDHPSDAFVIELADHAEMAAAALTADAAVEMARKGAVYVYRSAVIEEKGLRPIRAAEQFGRLAVHPGADDYLRAQGHLGAGQALYRLGKLDEANAHYDGMESCLDLEHDRYGATLLKTGRTIVNSHHDNGPWVGEAHKEAAEFWRSIGDHRREIASLVNFGVWHCDDGDRAVAYEAIQKAYEMAAKVGFKRAEEAAIGTLGMMKEEDERFEEGRADLQRALELAREMQNAVAEIQWITALGELERHRGELDAAERQYRLAIDMSMAHGIDIKREYAEAYLACVLVAAGRLDEARGLWNRAHASIVARNDQYTLRFAKGSMETALIKGGWPRLKPDGSFPD